MCSLRACHMWLTRNHMFIREIWGKFTSFIFWNFEISKFQKSELGKFIPNFPLKHVITSTNLLHIFRTSFFKNTSEWLFLISVQLILFPRLRYTWYSESLNYFSFIIPRFSKKVSTKSFFLGTARLWNSLHVHCLPLNADLNFLKTIHKQE